ALFYVQVKSTRKGYKGSGRNRKLCVAVTRDDVKKLQAANAPAYVAGIDIEKEKGYLLAITSTMTRGVSGIPTRHPIHCKTIKTLWQEVDAYWSNLKAKALATSRLS